MYKKCIEEVEINFCNRCSADCFICSKPHGNKGFMSMEVFITLMHQLKDISVNTMVVSGNGDAFLHPNFIEYLRIIKKDFPNTRKLFFSNFYMFTPDKTDIIVSECLLDEVHTRIDSLDVEIFDRSTKLKNTQKIFDNIRYFLSKNDSIEFHIGYSSIPQYVNRCIRIVKQFPYHSPFSDAEVQGMKDEYNDIVKYFNNMDKQLSINFSQINQSLWAERIQAKKDEEARCPKLALFNKIIWVCPDGSIDVCGYDDEQNKYIAGNILHKNIWDIWTSTKRLEIIDNIKHRVYKEYPCNNPKCCEMGK